MSSSPNSKPPLLSRSINEVISSLRTSFRDSDFKDAERHIKAREEILLRREKEAIDARWREKFDILEAKSTDLGLEVLRLEEERRRLRRECEINDNKVNDLARELSLMKEREEKAIKRYDLSLNEIRDGERKNDELLQQLEEVQSSYLVNIAALKDENDVLRRGMMEKEEEIMVLVEKSNESWERGKRESEVEIEELRVKIAVMESDKVKLDAQLKELRENHMKKDVRMNEVMKENEILVMRNREVEELRMKIEDMEAFKVKLDAQLKELRENHMKKDVKMNEAMKENEILVMRKREVEGLERKVENLESEKMRIMEKNECLEREKKEMLKEENEAIWRYEQLEKQVLKLEDDVANWMLSNVPSDKKLSSTQIGKIICGVIKVLDSEEVGIISNNNGQTKKGGKLQKGDFIVLSDSESDSEDIELKRKRASSQYSSDDGHSNHKIKKLTGVQHELVKNELSISASSSRSDNKFVPPQKKLVAAIRQCDERSSQTDRLMSPQAKELIANCRRSRAL